MKTEPYFYPQPNYLTSRTAIKREQKQFIQIAFAVHLSAVIPAKRYRSDSVTMKSAVSILVYFYILCNNKNYKKTSEGLSDIEAMKHADSVANEYLNKTLEDNEL